MKPDLLRLLEEWTTHQDYFWFLAALAWAGVIAAEIRRDEATGRLTARGWLVAFSLAQIAGALLELVLLAQDLQIPYTRLDFAMGLAQALGAAALAWGAWPGRRLVEMPVGLALIGIAVARFRWPVEAGLALGLAQAGALLGLSRSRPALPAVVVVLLAVVPLLATHGPWAYAIGQGRRTTDWSHFSLFAAASLMLAGGLLAAAGWQQRLRQVMPEAVSADTLRRDLHRALVLLIAWLAGGVLLAVWYGRQARRAYETNLLRRVEMIALAIDPAMIAEALGPELKIDSIERKYYPDGRQVMVATVPHTRAPVYMRLRARQGFLRARNPDIRSLSLAVLRDGHMLMLGSRTRADAITHVIHHDVTPEDLARISDGQSYLEGPTINTGEGAQFSARVPLWHPDSGRFLGWLAADVDATRWAVTFTQARLQTMVLVAVGVGLWTLAVAYRLRREARDAAEQRAAAAAAADRMKSAFLAKVSHELRTPIQSVLGYGELLAGAPLAEPHRAWLTALRSHGGIMLRLVNDLIDLGALQSGAFQLEPEPVELRAALEECAAALRPAAAAKRLVFHVELAPDLPTWVRADGVRLRQVLLNLLTNAVKFTPAGSVSLHARCVDRQLEFAVSDTGPGIPAAQRARLFQPFARLDPAASDGSGLGLALVQGLCGVMGGRVRFVAGDAPGATFVVTLPLPACEAPAPTLGDPALLAPGLSGLRVLLAEDNTLVRELLVAFLTGNGAQVSVAVDGPAALARAKENPPDVLLLDIALPGLDGVAVAETLRREGPADLRIIGLSAHAGPRDEARARVAGMDAFLAKPVSLPRLAQTLTAAAPGQKLAATMSLLAGKVPDGPLRTRLVEQFESETPRLLTEMRAALAAADWTRLRRAAHYLKNSADVLGVDALQEACQRLASLPDPADAPAALQLFMAVETAVPDKHSISADSVSADCR